VSLALSAYAPIVDEAKERGAPIDSLIIEPLIGRVNGIGVSRKPPHPSARGFSTSTTSASRSR